MDEIQQSGHSNAGYERRDLDPGAIAMFGVGLAAVIAVVLVVVYLLFDFMAASRLTKETPLSPLATDQTPPEPRLQVNPALDLKEMRRSEDNLFHSYGWVDREAEIVRIPVERAMELLVQKGLPTREGRVEPQGPATEKK